jgi:hypothetical protein
MKRLLGFAMLGLMALGFVGTASASPRYYAPRAARFAAREAFLNRRIHELRPFYRGFTPAQIAWRHAERVRLERELHWLRHHYRY